MLAEPVSPLANGVITDTEHPSDHGVGRAVSADKHNPGTHHVAMLPLVSRARASSTCRCASDSTMGSLLDTDIQRLSPTASRRRRRHAGYRFGDSVAPSWSSSGTCCMIQTPDTTIWAPITTTDTSIRLPRRAVTFDNSKPSDTPSHSLRPRKPRGAYRRQLTIIFGSVPGRSRQ